jgi:hypothetical protein
VTENLRRDLIAVMAASSGPENALDAILDLLDSRAEEWADSNSVACSTAPEMWCECPSDEQVRSLIAALRQPQEGE